MPSLHNFDTCWGNRRYIQDMYWEQTPYDWFHDHEAGLNVSSSSRGFSSSNGYYGYHQPVVVVQTPCEPVLSMDIEPQDNRTQVETRESQSRKRPFSNAPDELDVKRVKTGTGGC